MSDTCPVCGCVLACPICEVPIDNMEEDLTRLTEDNRKLKQLVVDLHWMAIHGDYANGVTDYTGIMDEGIVRSEEYLMECEKRAKELDVDLKVTHPGLDSPQQTR